jgi:drug/metabolite transporter (DMT)-like permease
MKLENWLGILVTGTMCIRFLPISAKASYYLQALSAFASLVLAIIWFIGEYRKNPKILLGLVLCLVGVIVVAGGIILLVRFAPQ